MTGYDHIVDTLAKWEINDHPELAKALLQLFISLAGEKLVEIEKTKAQIYESILTNKLVKPEHYKLVYGLMQESKEKLK